MSTAHASAGALCRRSPPPPPSVRFSRERVRARTARAPWVEDVHDASPEIANVRFVLCSPQGAANVGACARAMQNFGVYELKLVDVGPAVLAEGSGDADSSRPGTSIGILDEASEGEGRAPERASDQGAPLSEEALRYACAADWLLEDAERCEDVDTALRGCTFVLATTARPRTGTPLMTAREAAKLVAEEAKRGKVAVLFGNERTGLTNEELSWASAAVVVPTAGAGKLCRKSLKYTGATGPTSLNLSHAVGIIAYEIYMACVGDVASGSIVPENQKLLTAEEKVTLRNELVAARRSLDVLESDAETSNVSTTASSASEEDEEDEDLMRKRESKSFERLLAAAPVCRSDAAALFQLSRRVSAMKRGAVVTENDDENLLDRTVVECLRSLVAADASRAPTVRNARNHIRAQLGVSLTNREIERALARASIDR